MGVLSYVWHHAYGLWHVHHHPCGVVSLVRGRCVAHCTCAASWCGVAHVVLHTGSKRRGEWACSPWASHGAEVCNASVLSRVLTNVVWCKWHVSGVCGTHQCGVVHGWLLRSTRVCSKHRCCGAHTRHCPAASWLACALHEQHAGPVSRVCHQRGLYPKCAAPTHSVFHLCGAGSAVHCWALSPVGILHVQGGVFCVSSVACTRGMHKWLVSRERFVWRTKKIPWVPQRFPLGSCPWARADRWHPPPSCPTRALSGPAAAVWGRSALLGCQPVWLLCNRSLPAAPLACFQGWKGFVCPTPPRPPALLCKSWSPVKGGSGVTSASSQEPETRWSFGSAGVWVLLTIYLVFWCSNSWSKHRGTSLGGITWLFSAPSPWRHTSDLYLLINWTTTLLCFCYFKLAERKPYIHHIMLNVRSTCFLLLVIYN